MSLFVNQLEKKIRVKIKLIQNRTLKVKDAEVNKLINKLKEFDMASAEILNKKYIGVVKTLHKENI